MESNQLRWKLGESSTRQSPEINLAKPRCAFSDLCIIRFTKL